MKRRLILWVPLGAVRDLPGGGRRSASTRPPTRDDPLAADRPADARFRRSPPAVAGRPGLSSADAAPGPAAARQHLRQLVPALPGRGAAARRARPPRRADRRHRDPRPARGPRRASSPPMAIRSARSAPTSTGGCRSTLGSAGVPETFVVDGRGIIRHQHIGAITRRRHARDRRRLRGRAMRALLARPGACSPPRRRSPIRCCRRRAMPNASCPIRARSGRPGR